MSTNLIPFGKYKGQPIESIQEDRQYIDWLLAQSWFRERHQDFYTVIINNFQEAADTPEHNAMHVKFLNDDYVLELLGRYKSEYKDFHVRERGFEKNGWDVVINLTRYEYADFKDELIDLNIKIDAHIKSTKYSIYGDDYRLFPDHVRKEIFDTDKELEVLHKKIRRIDSALNENIRFFLELKPTVSDDFPAVLRQIKALKQTSNVILLVGKYTGVGATQEQFVDFMQTENITVIFDESAA